LAIGLAIGANHSKMTSTSFDTFYNTQNTTVNKTRSYDISPLLRYYVDINEKFKIFGQFNAGIGFGKSSQLSSNPGGFDANVKTTTYSASIKPGIAIFPSKKIAIELGFTLFSYAKSDNNASGTQLAYNYKMENFNFGFNSFTPNLGVNFHF
jgi:opacity protein-like surface antigen